MTITTNVPDFMVIGARTGFLAAIDLDAPSDYKRFATTVNMTSKELTLVDLGGAPMPVSAKGRREQQDFIEKTMKINSLPWEITVPISWNAIQDDQTGTLNNKVRAAGENFMIDMNRLCFDMLDKGNVTTTYPAGYDGLALFSASHVDSGGKYTTVQSNTNSKSLTPDNFNTVRAAGRKFVNDQNVPWNFTHNLLIVNPDDERNAAQIKSNPWVGFSADRTVNPYQGKVDYITSPYITSGGWYVVDESRSVKPVLFVLREMPNLQSAWFDPEGPDGGTYKFKFYARYNVFPGAWPLIIKGN